VIHTQFLSSRSRAFPCIFLKRSSPAPALATAQLTVFEKFLLSKAMTAKHTSRPDPAKPLIHPRIEVTMSLSLQVAWLLLLAIPIASVAWTITHEEVFREPREYCQQQSKRAPRFSTRKFFYLLTCEYCFSHYVTLLFLVITRYKLLYQDWRGYLLAFFALVWVANQYMSIYNRLRLDIKHENIEIKAKEEDVKERQAEPPERRAA
jgi:hypothetical protein